MSWEASGYIKQLDVPLSRSEKLLLLILADYHNTDTDEAWPSLNTLAADSLMSQRTIIRLTQSLEARKIIRITRTDGRASNRYAFNWDLPVRTKRKSTTKKSEGGSDTMSEGGLSQSCQRGSDMIMSEASDIMMSPEPTENRQKTRHSDPSPKPVANAPVSGRKADPFYESFARCFEASNGMPYLSKKADFVQLAALRKGLGARLTPQAWEQALTNYFASHVGTRTLADVSVRFATFYKSPLDRFGKPVDLMTNVERHNRAVREAVRKEEANGVSLKFLE